MDAQKNQDERLTSSVATSSPISSCRRKKNEQATFFEDLRDHVDEFINASVAEHKTCFQKTIQKMFGLSKVVSQQNSNATKEVESSLPLQTTVQE